MVWENGPTNISYNMLTIKNCNTIFLPNSAISFCDRYLLIDFMLLFRPIWQKALYPWWNWSERSENRITKQLWDVSQTYPDGIIFLRGLLKSSILFMNKCKNNVLVNWLQFMFWTQKEPVHKSHLLMKPTTLGALRACATILQSLVKDLFLLPLVTLSSPWLKSSTWNTAYIYILFCDNYGLNLSLLPVPSSYIINQSRWSWLYRKCLTSCSSILSIMQERHTIWMHYTFIFCMHVYCVCCFGFCYVMCWINLRCVI